MKQDPTHDGVSSELHISNVDSSDSGTYFCEARNVYGRERQMVQLVVQGKPARHSPDSKLVMNAFQSLLIAQKAWKLFQ